jgi:hypothetical protein
MLCLPDTMLHSWLFGISSARVKPAIREALIRYQREVYAVLARGLAELRERVGMGCVQELLTRATVGGVTMDSRGLRNTIVVDGAHGESRE